MKNKYDAFKKMGFRKSDEMELAIQLKSVRLSWIYTEVFLLVWTFYESYRVYVYHERLNLIPSFLLVTQNLIMICAQRYYVSRMSKKEDEDEGEAGTSFGHFLMIALAVAAVIVVAGSVAAFIIQK